MSVASAIDRFAVSTTVRRAAEGSYVDGLFMPGADQSIAIKASIQPLTGIKRENLPEGIRRSGKWMVYSRTALMVNDKMTIEGTECVLLSVDNWSTHGGYFSAVAGDADGIT